MHTLSRELYSEINVLHQKIEKLEEKEEH